MSNSSKKFPKNRFLSRRTLTRLVQFLKLLRIWPWKWLSNTLNWLSNPPQQILHGKYPVNWFVSISSSTSYIKFPISWGKKLDGLLWRRCKYCKLLRFPSEGQKIFNQGSKPHEEICWFLPAWSLISTRWLGFSQATTLPPSFSSLVT